MVNKNSQLSMRLLAFYFLAVFFFSAAPLAVIYPSASASAGLSTGFLRLFMDPVMVALVAAVGFVSSRFTQIAMVMLPIGFVLMYVIGALLAFDSSEYPNLQFFLLGAILIFGLDMSVLKNRWHLGALLATASIGFQLGSHTQQSVPSLADPLFFLLGQILAVQLLLAACISCIYVIVPIWTRLRRWFSGAPAEQV